MAELHERVNDALRVGIGLCIDAVAWLAEVSHSWRIRSYVTRQQRLRARYGVRPETPVRRYGPEVERDIEARARALGSSVLWVLTSGSTRTPKRIVYTRSRILRTKLLFALGFARIFRALRLRRRSLFVFSSIRPDGSLTSLLLRERRLPSRLSLVQAPYRALGHPRLVTLADEYGAAAVRLWLLLLANPGVIYATNPSTLSSFFAELERDWEGSVALVRDFAAGRLAGDRVLTKVRRRVATSGAARRLSEVARLPACPPATALVPGLEAFVCWDGGYVRGFLEEVRERLPADRILHIPMYSMSTETVETVPDVDGRDLRFLPLAPGVLYEFLEEGDEDSSSRLLPPERLETGRAYTLVVSDAYGLRRYQTEDLFLCTGRFRGLPDLRFLRRRGLAYSFTGEKLTAEHLAELFERLRETRLSELGSRLLTCVPSRPEGALLPCYRLVVVSQRPDEMSLPDDSALAIRAHADELLREIQPEYRAKRESGRLGAMELEQLSREELARRVSGGASRGPWESQFKFLPLYPRLWEEMGRVTHEAAV